MTISMDKQYRTRDGREVRIYAVDGWSDFPIHGAIKFESGWKSCCWTLRGRFTPFVESPNDLIEVKPRIQREYWVNVSHDSDHAWAFGSKQIADNMGCCNTIRHACVKVVIDCEEGEGL